MAAGTQACAGHGFQRRTVHVKHCEGGAKVAEDARKDAPYVRADEGHASTVAELVDAQGLRQRRAREHHHLRAPHTVDAAAGTRQTSEQARAQDPATHGSARALRARKVCTVWGRRSAQL
jgi:hypothetical protein